MTYLVNKTDGTAIPILDGTANVTATSLTLVGRLATNYGESQNENFVRLLENFSFTVSPANPIRGQLWYDVNVNNIKVYNGSTWQPVGNNIVGNVSLTGNLTIGQNAFRIQDIGHINFINNVSSGDYSFYSNIAGVNTRTLYINGADGLIQVNANATSDYGITTKVYVDAIVSQSGLGANIAMAANVAAANAAIIAANVAMKAYVDDRDEILYANAAVQANQITAANAAIVTANISLKSYTDNQITTANTAVAHYSKDYADSLNSSLAITVAGVDSSAITANVNMKNYVDDQIDGLNSGVDLKANIDSPDLTGTPLSVTAPFGTNTRQIATTQYVMTRSVYWDGSKKFVSTQDPTSGDGNDGDIWFKYS